MQVVEIFKSIQGEGTLIGSPMVFIRLWGCNMKCIWCDTRYSWAPEFKDKTIRTDYSPEELGKFLLENYPETTWFNFTGGEPTLWAEELLQTTIMLQNYSKKVSIQTNGKEWKEKLFKRLDKVCMDIKCPQSGEKSDLNSINKLRTQDEIKFVLETDQDIKYAKNVITTHESEAFIIIQPVMHPELPLDTYYENIRILVENFSSLQTDRIRILPQLHQLLWRDQAGK